MEAKQGHFIGPVESMKPIWAVAGPTCRRRKRKGMTGRGTVGKTAVAGAKDRATNTVTAHVVKRTDAKTLHGFIVENAAPGATVYTDEAAAYVGMPFEHEVSITAPASMSGTWRTRTASSPSGPC